MDDATYRSDVALACRGLASFGAGDSIGGHVSVRVSGEDAYWVNAFDRAFCEVTPDDVVKMDFSGRVLTQARAVSIGSAFHTGIYQLRPDVNAIVHSHGFWVTSQAAFNRPPKMWHNLSTYFLDDCVMSPDDTLDAIAPALGSARTILIPWHGGITVDRTLGLAAAMHHTLEFAARLDVQHANSGAEPMPEHMCRDMMTVLEKVDYLDQTWELLRRRGAAALAAEGSYPVR
jgi:L-fuculose-phosphate aldolase